MVPSDGEELYEGGLDSAFRLLGDQQRRHALYLLREHGEMAIDDLADVLTGWLAVRNDEGATPDDRERIRLRLVHVHVPKLEAAGIVDFEAESGRVTLDRLPPVVDRLLDGALELEPGTSAEAIAAAEPQEG